MVNSLQAHVRICEDNSADVPYRQVCCFYPVTSNIAIVQSFSVYDPQHPLMTVEEFSETRFGSRHQRATPQRRDPGTRIETRSSIYETPSKNSQLHVGVDYLRGLEQEPCRRRNRCSAYR